MDDIVICVLCAHENQLAALSVESKKKDDQLLPLLVRSHWQEQYSWMAGHL